MADSLPIIFEEDVQAKLTRMQARLETSLGRSLAPADVEMLLANAFVFEAQLICISGNQAMRQCLSAFATGAMLERLGDLVGVTRIPASGAECTIRFSFISGHNAVQIPPTRVQSIDGKVIFITTDTVDIAVGVDHIDLIAICQKTGSDGNNYDPGKISVILDPQPFLTTAVNVDTSNGGSDS